MVFLLVSLLGFETSDQLFVPEDRLRPSLSLSLPLSPGAIEAAISRLSHSSARDSNQEETDKGKGKPRLSAGSAPCQRANPCRAFIVILACHSLQQLVCNLHVCLPTASQEVVKCKVLLLHSQQASTPPPPPAVSSSIFHFQ